MFLSSLKNEGVYRTVYATKVQAKRDVIAYIEGFSTAAADTRPSNTGASTKFTTPTNSQP